jgi:hypothetical protein
VPCRADVRFGAHTGLKSDIASCRSCAKLGHRGRTNSRHGSFRNFSRSRRSQGTRLEGVAHKSGGFIGAKATGLKQHTHRFASPNNSPSSRRWISQISEPIAKLPPTETCVFTFNRSPICAVSPDTDRQFNAGMLPRIIHIPMPAIFSRCYSLIASNTDRAAPEGCSHHQMFRRVLGLRRRSQKLGHECLKDFVWHGSRVKDPG